MLCHSLWCEGLMAAQRKMLYRYARLLLRTNESRPLASAAFGYQLQHPSTSHTPRPSSSHPNLDHTTAIIKDIDAFLNDFVKNPVSRKPVQATRRKANRASNEFKQITRLRLEVPTLPLQSFKYQPASNSKNNDIVLVSLTPQTAGDNNRNLNFSEKASQSGADNPMDFPFGKPNITQLNHVALRVSTSVRYFFVESVRMIFLKYPKKALFKRRKNVSIKGSIHSH